MLTPSAQQSGLARWREKQRLEREAKLVRLAELRLDATEEERDGRTFRLVRIPDRYEFGTPNPKEAPCPCSKQ